jgi:hypothetical protein
MSNIRAGIRVRGNNAADIPEVVLLPRGFVVQLSPGMSCANKDGDEDVAMLMSTPKRMEYDAAARVADMMIRPTPTGKLLPA